MVTWALSSITWSVSRKPKPSSCASSRPTVLLPVPMKPTRARLRGWRQESISDHVIQRIVVLPLQQFNPFAEVGHGDLLQNFHDRFPHLFHHAANPAPGFVRTGTAGVK